jgi:hypothetical protein
MVRPLQSLQTWFARFGRRLPLFAARTAEGVQPAVLGAQMVLLAEVAVALIAAGVAALVQAKMRMKTSI